MLGNMVLSQETETHQQELHSALCSLWIMAVVLFFNYETSVQLTLEQHRLELHGLLSQGCFLVNAGQGRKHTFPSF